MLVFDSLYCTGCFKKSSPPPKTVWNIFTLVKSFCLTIHIHIYLPIFVDLS